MSKIDEHININNENKEGRKRREPISIRFSYASINRFKNRHLKKLNKKREELKEEQEYVNEKMDDASSLIMKEMYARRLEKLSDKIRIVNYQIDAANRKISYKEKRTPRPIKVFASVFARIYGAYRVGKKIFNKMVDKIVKWNEKIDNYGEPENENIDVYEESKNNSEEIKNNIEKGFANMSENNKSEQVEKPREEKTSNVSNSSEENVQSKNDSVTPQQNGSNIQKPRYRDVNETDEEYVNHLKDFYSKQFPNIDVENSRVNASHIDSSEDFKTADDVINQVVGIQNQTPTNYRTAEPIQIAEERPYMNNNMYNNSSSLYNDSDMTMQSESNELRQLRDKLKELNDLINDKQQSVANRHARLTEQEKNIVAQEQRNEELYAKVNQLLNSKREKIDKLTAEEKKSQQRGQTLNERQAQVMQEQEALEMMLNEGSEQNNNSSSYTM